MGDDHLLREALAGDEQALSRLVRREWQPLYARIYRMVPDRAEAEDLTQETLLRAIKAVAGEHYTDTGVPFGAYLAAVARNLVRNRWRRRRPIPVTLTLDDAPEVPSDDAGPEENALAADNRRRLDRLLDELPADYQTVIRLRIYEERPAKEVAAIMGRSPEAVRVLQHRAIMALRSRLPESESKGTSRG